MKALLIGLLLMGGCSAAAQDSTPNPVPHSRSVSEGVTPNSSTITSNGDQARRFKIRLTLTAPDDLKVKESDVVILGQVIADRVRDRTRLQFQKDGLVREIGRLRKLAVMPVPPVRSLPDTDYMEEAANVEKIRQKAFEASKQREQQQRKLDVLANLDQADLPESVIPHEQLVLEQRQREENTAQAEVQLSLGKLSKAKELRQDKEYAHSLEMSKRAIAIKESELKTQGQIADLEARLSQVEISLSQLSAVRSPYSGRIQKIKFVGQSDQNLSVELTLLVSSGGSSLGTISLSEKNTPTSETSDSERETSPSSPDH